MNNKSYIMYKVIIRITIMVLFSVVSYSQCNFVNLLQTNPQAAPYSSENGTVHTPGHAFDIGSDSFTTKWGATYRPEGQSLGIDFGVQFDFCSIQLVWGANEYPTDFVIKASNNFYEWTQLASITGNT